MSTLIIRKKSLKTWLHTDSILGDFIISKFYFNADNGNFQVVEQGQSRRVIYNVTDITLYDDTDGGVAETFANITALSLRLEELNYPAFQYDGQIVSIANLIEAGTNVTITGDGTEASPYVISATGGGGGAVDSVNGDTGAVIVDLQSATDEGNETTNDVIFRLDADKYVKINNALQRIELWDETIDDTIPITHWDKDSIYIKDATGNQISISAGYTNNLLTDGSTLEIFGSNIALTNAGLFLNLTNELMQFGNGGGDLVTYTLDKISVNGVDYTLPTGATSQIATLLDIPSPITIDATPTDGSSNAVSSNGVFDALALKQDDLWDFKNKGIILIEDFNLTNSNNFLNVSAGGGNPQPSTTYPNRTNQNGVVYINTGTLASGASAFVGGGNYFLGAGAISYEVYLNVETLSDATNRFYNIFGFGNFSNAINPQQGIFFLYDEGGVLAFGANPPSPNWKCVTINTGTRTFTTTSVPVTASAWVKLTIEINANASSVEFFIDNVSVATHTTNIPSTSTALNISNSIIKTIGTTNRQAYLDYAIFRQIFTTTR